MSILQFYSSLKLINPTLIVLTTSKVMFAHPREILLQVYKTFIMEVSVARLYWLGSDAPVQTDSFDYAVIHKMF